MSIIIKNKTKKTPDNYDWIKDIHNFHLLVEDMNAWEAKVNAWLLMPYNG